MSSDFGRTTIYSNEIPASIFSDTGILQMLSAVAAVAISRGAFTMIDRYWANTPLLLKKYRGLAKIIVTPLFCRALGLATAPWLVTILDVGNAAAVSLSFLPSVLFYYLLPPDFFDVLWTKSSADDLDYSSSAV